MSNYIFFISKKRINMTCLSHFKCQSVYDNTIQLQELTIPVPITKTNGARKRNYIPPEITYRMCVTYHNIRTRVRVQENSELRIRHTSSTVGRLRFNHPLFLCRSEQWMPRDKISLRLIKFRTEPSKFLVNLFVGKVQFFIVNR